ncbi:hypothetical protein BofuT4_P021830.1 [Botrytis cinerea T4]|uniref:Uncharacterized protein n=1 Tax=Botryotinia fuckeliana (strain T4) TaxID=999810 RepID=G2YHD0_BOTF4|nr:hypothetical protein BofuT4_P021830.1 [Botrytis cinerea T4]
MATVLSGWRKPRKLGSHRIFQISAAPNADDASLAIMWQVKSTCTTYFYFFESTCPSPSLLKRSLGLTRAYRGHRQTQAFTSLGEHLKGKCEYPAQRLCNLRVTRIVAQMSFGSTKMGNCRGCREQETSSAYLVTRWMRCNPSEDFPALWEKGGLVGREKTRWPEDLGARLPPLPG